MLMERQKTKYNVERIKMRVQIAESEKNIEDGTE